METTNRESLREETAGELRALLARRRVSASELSRRLGWKQSYMARRIDGRVALDLDDLQAIAHALEVSVMDLLPSSVNRATVSAPAGQNLCSVTKSTRPKDTRPPGRPETRAPLTPSTERTTGRRPQRIGSTTRPVSRRAA
jgi:DNA-binding Xre family transcriptional regulator